MGDQRRAQPQHEVKSRWAASTDLADAIHDDQQGKQAAHAASAHQRKAAPEKPVAKAPDPEELKHNGEGASMQLLDAELLDVARELYKLEPMMQEATNVIVALRSEASQEEMELNRDKANEAEEVEKHLEGDDDKRKHKRLQGHLRDSIRQKTGDKEMQMSVAKMNIESSIAPSFVQFKSIMGKATTHGLHGKGLERSTSYLREVLERYSLHALWGGIEVPMLAQMKSELTKLTNHLNIAPAKNVKIDKLAKVDDEAAAYDKAWLAICAVQSQANIVKGVNDLGDVRNALALIESHLGDAIHFAHAMDPDNRKQLKRSAADMVSEARTADQIALSNHINRGSLEALAVTLMHALSK